MGQVWEKARKIIFWKPDTRLVAVLAVSALLALLVPLFRISVYTNPWYDDYGYAIAVKNFLAEEYSLPSALKGAVYCVRTQWWAWQGTFSSCFLMAIAPMAWEEGLYYLGTQFLIVILPLSVFTLMWTVLRRILGADAPSGVILSAAAAAAAVVFIYSDRDGFYWFNAGIHYVGTHSLLLLTAAVWIRLLMGEGRWSAVFLFPWSLLGAVAGSGANYVTALQGAVLAASLIGLGALLCRKRTLLLLPSFVVYAYGFRMNVIAPGNSKRAVILNNGGRSAMGALEAVKDSFLEAFRYLWTFTGFRTLLLMALLVPVIWGMVKKISFRFRFPGLVLAWSFCLYATGFTPSLYAMGHGGVGRTLNAVKITFQILLFFNQVYWLGWLQKKVGQEGWAAKAARRMKGLLKMPEACGGVPISFYLAMGGAMLALFLADPWRVGHYSAYCAYWSVHTGDANEYHKEYLARVETIVNGGDVVEVEPYHFRPAPLFMGDLSTDPNNGANRFMANWYGKEAVICRSTE